MNAKIDIKSLLAGAILGALILFSTGAGQHTAWDYKLISGYLRQDNPNLSQQLDQASAEGWEVITATSDGGRPLVILRKPK